MTTQTTEILIWKFAEPPIEIHESWELVGETWDRWIYKVPVILKKEEPKLKIIEKIQVLYWAIRFWWADRS